MITSTIDQKVRLKIAMIPGKKSSSEETLQGLPWYLKCGILTEISITGVKDSSSLQEVVRQV